MKGKNYTKVSPTRGKCEKKVGVEVMVASSYFHINRVGPKCQSSDILKFLQSELYIRNKSAGPIISFTFPLSYVLIFLKPCLLLLNLLFTMIMLFQQNGYLNRHVYFIHLKKISPARNTFI